MNYGILLLAVGVAASVSNIHDRYLEILLFLSIKDYLGEIAEDITADIAETDFRPLFHR